MFNFNITYIDSVLRWNLWNAPPPRIKFFPLLGDIPGHSLAVNISISSKMIVCILCIHLVNIVNFAVSNTHRVNKDISINLGHCYQHFGQTEVTNWDLLIGLLFLYIEMKELCEARVKPEMSSNFWTMFPQIDPPFETASERSELFADPCRQWEPNWNGQLIRKYQWTLLLQVI